MEELTLSFSAEVGTISATQFADIRTFVDKVTAVYQTAVVTQDSLKDFKGDLARLRKLNTELEGERKRIKKIWQAPYLEWEAMYKEATLGIASAIENLDSQIKVYEEEARNGARKAVEALIWKEASDMDHRVHAFMTEYDNVFGWVWKDEYANRSYSANKRIQEVRDRLRQIMLDLDVIGDDSTLLALYADTGNLSEAQLRKREEEDRKKRFEEAQKATAQPIADAAPQSPAVYGFSTLRVDPVDENTLREDEMKTARLKRTFVGPKYRLIILMKLAECLGIEMIKDNQ